jgi:hypothetical protein
VITSKLLHAIRLNIITDKELYPSEVIMVLDYIVISATDLLNAIEDFTYPGRVAVIESHPDEADLRMKSAKSCLTLTANLRLKATSVSRQGAQRRPKPRHLTPRRQATGGAFFAGA